MISGGVIVFCEDNYLHLVFIKHLKIVLADGLTRDAGTAVVWRGAEKELRAMETYKNQKCRKIVTNYDCFSSSTILTSETIAEIIENRSEFSVFVNSCKYVSCRS